MKPNNTLVSKVLLIIALTSVSACEQTYTTSEGKQQTLNAPKVFVNADKTLATFDEQALKVGKVPQKFRKTMRVGNVSGFSRRSIFEDQQITDAGAATVTEQVLEASEAGPGSRYTLDVKLLEWTSGNAFGPLETSTTMLYTVRDTSGKEVFQTTETAKFVVPFSAAPVGAVRSKLSYIGSFMNNMAQFVEALNKA